MNREELLRDLKQVREKEKDKKYSFGQLNVFNMVSDVINYLEHEEKPKMTNLEWLKNKAEEFNVSNFSGICTSIYKLKNKGKGCDGIKCNCCEFNDIEKCIDYILEEHKESIKLKRWEYDLLKEFKKNWNYAERQVFWNLNKKGYFKGVIDTSMPIQYILNNCEIVPDNYNFEECK